MSSQNSAPLSLGNQPIRRPEAGRVESHLLTASGVLAIWLVAAVIGLEFGFGLQTLIYVAFTGVFIAIANGERLGLAKGERVGLGSRMEVFGILVLFLLSVWVWFLTPADIILILTIVMIAEAPYVLSRRQCWGLMLVTNVAFLAVFIFYWNAQNLFLSWISMFALQAFALTSSLARVKEAQMKQQFFEQNAELVEARSALAEKSQMEERLRIAGDLHDSIGHQLTALRLQLEALAQLAPAELKPKVAVSQKLSLDLLENIRSIVKRMSSEEPTDLVLLIQQIDDDTPGVNVSLVGAVPVISPRLFQQLIPCIKEGLSNAIRHSGATEIDIEFQESSLTIKDNGKGLATGSEFGFGLKNIKQRLAPFSGEVTLENDHSGGCKLSISLAGGFYEGAES